MSGDVLGGLELSSDPACLDRLHGAAVRVLEETGVRFDTEQARGVLRKGGAHVDGAVARIPAQLVEWALHVTPSTFDLYSREGRRAFTFGADELGFTAGGGSTYALDWRTGQVRAYTLADAVEGARLVDVLPQFSQQFMVTGMISDVPSDRWGRHAFNICIRNSAKPLILPVADRATLREFIEFMAREAGGLSELRARPTCTVEDNTTSPLVYDRQACDHLLLGAEYGLPVGTSGWPQLGATGPITVAGSVVVAHAEHLAGLVLVQLVHEGLPCLVKGSTPLFDMRSASISTGAPERVLGGVLLMQLGRRLRLPVATNAVCSDAKTLTVQAGAERAILCLATAAAGASVVGGLGWLDSLNTISHEMLVLDTDMAEAVLRLRRGAACDDESLALDVIRAVGHGGHYVEQDHTLQRVRKDVWYPTVWERSSRLPQRGDDDSLQMRTRERIQHLLASHRPPVLSYKSQQALAALVG